MKKKIIGMLIIMLLIATAVPAVESLKDYKSYPIVSNKTQTSPMGNWTEIQKLLASDNPEYDRFGYSVSLDGDTALIGAPYDDDNGELSGSAYVFTRIGTTWTQQAKLLSSDNPEYDRFGFSVSLDGDTALIGAPYDVDNGDLSGSAYIFTRDGGTPNLEIDITGGIGINAVITNNGTANASVVWQIHVEGGILELINTTVNGTIGILAGESKTVRTGLFFGFGPITISVKVADVEETAEGTQFIIFTKVNK